MLENLAVPGAVLHVLGALATDEGALEDLDSCAVLNILTGEVTIEILDETGVLRLLHVGKMVLVFRLGA